MPVLVDTHVHFHDCFSLALFLNHALANFQKYSAEESGEVTDKVMILTESKGVNFFGTFLEFSRNDRMTEEWCFQATEERSALCARHRNGEELYIVAGGQIVTREQLEVLSLGREQDRTSAMTLQETIQAVEESGAIAVLPWGFGKWSGKRGRIIDKHIESIGRDTGIFLGDNGNRCAVLPRPKQFAVAERRGAAILPGSDPLPFPAQQRRAGSVGVRLSGNLDRRKPAESLLAKLRNGGTPEPYGRLEGVLPFLYYQMRMQLKKHLNI